MQINILSTSHPSFQTKTSKHSVAVCSLLETQKNKPLWSCLAEKNEPRSPDLKNLQLSKSSEQNPNMSTTVSLLFKAQWSRKFHPWRNLKETWLGILPRTRWACSRLLREKQRLRNRLFWKERMILIGSLMRWTEWQSCWKWIRLWEMRIMRRMSRSEWRILSRTSWRKRVRIFEKE